MTKSKRLKKTNKLPLLILIILAIAALVLIWHLTKPGALKTPESIVYDSVNNLFLVSSTASGNIVSMDDSGHCKTFMKGLSNPRGMKFLSPYLYVAEPTQVVAIDVQAKTVVYSIPVDNAIMLNDIESDHQGLLYVTDTSTNQLHIIEPATKKVQSLSDPRLLAPNGLVYDYPRRQLLIVCFRQNSPILSYNIESRQFSVFKDTIYDELDGIAIDGLGRIYFSSWGEQTVFQIPQEQNRFVSWKTGLSSAADIYYHQPTNELIVPLFERDRVERFKL